MCQEGLGGFLASFPGRLARSDFVVAIELCNDDFGIQVFRPDVERGNSLCFDQLVTKNFACYTYSQTQLYFTY